MRRRWPIILAAFIVFAPLAIAVFGFVVMSLWNRLMPQLFGLRTLTFWQAIGLLILARIFFGGFRGGPRGDYMSRRMRERWEKMTPEERHAFREGMWSRRHRPCGGGETP